MRPKPFSGSGRGGQTCEVYWSFLSYIGLFRLLQPGNRGQIPVTQWSSILAYGPCQGVCLSCFRVLIFVVLSRSRQICRHGYPEKFFKTKHRDLFLIPLGDLVQCGMWPPDDIPLVWDFCLILPIVLRVRESPAPFETGSRVVSNPKTGVIYIT